VQFFAHLDCIHIDSGTSPNLPLPLRARRRAAFFRPAGAKKARAAYGCTQKTLCVFAARRPVWGDVVRRGEPLRTWRGKRTPRGRRGFPDFACGKCAVLA